MDKRKESYTSEERQDEAGVKKVPPGAYVPRGTGAPTPPEFGGPDRPGLDKGADDREG